MTESIRLFANRLLNTADPSYIITDLESKSKYAPQEYGSSYYILKTLKQAFDPNGIMNMGTLIPLRK